MISVYDEFLANKCERLKSFENTVKNIFHEKLNKFSDCFEKTKNPESITHIQIFDYYGRYYFKKVNGCFKGVLQQFDIEGRRLKNIKKLKGLKKYLYYTHYILFRTISLKNSKNLVCELDQDLKNLVREEELRYYIKNLVGEEELRYYINSTFLFRLSKSL